MTEYHRKTQNNIQELLKLKIIVEKNPNYYLDEIALVFGIDTGKSLHLTTVWSVEVTFSSFSTVTDIALPSPAYLNKITIISPPSVAFEIINIFGRRNEGRDEEGASGLILFRANFFHLHNGCDFFRTISLGGGYLNALEK